MSARFMTTSVMVASLLIGGLAFAQIPNFQRGQVITADQLNRIVNQVNSNTSALGGDGGTTHTVDCSSGTIADAMSQAQSGDTITITGTCNEAVVVGKDGITLDGGGSAVIDGAGIDRWAVDVTGRQRVTIKGLTVQNGHDAGIMITESSGVWLQDVTVRNARRHQDYDAEGHGIFVGHSSSAVLTGTIVTDSNAGNGIMVWQSSSALVLGNFTPRGSPLPRASVRANGNGGNGIFVAGSSSFTAFSSFGENTTVQAKTNMYSGISVEHSSSLLVGGTDIEVTNNQGNGLGVGGASSAQFGGGAAISKTVSGLFADNGGSGIVVWGSSFLGVWDDGMTVSIRATGNMWNGLWMGGGSQVAFDSPASESTSSLVFSGNGTTGISVISNGTFFSKFAIDVMNNSGNGINAWGNSYVDLYTSVRKTITGNGGDGIAAWNGVSLDIDVVTVTGSGKSDISAGLGSRVGWVTGSQIGSVYCDGSVLVFDNAACPDQ